MATGRKVTTNDIYRASYLLCCGGEVSDCYHSKGRVALVVDGEAINQADLKYRSGKALVSPKELREMINFIRDEYIRPLTNPQFQQLPRQTAKGTNPCKIPSSRLNQTSA